MRHAQFELDEQTRREAGAKYNEFLRVPDLSCGIYHLPVGSADPQSPHDEDEVYHVVSGRGRFVADEEDRPVGPGAVIYVEKHVPHRFHSIEEDLTVLVFFAPAET